MRCSSGLPNAPSTTRATAAASSVVSTRISTGGDVTAKKNRRIGGAFVHLTNQLARADARGVARRGFDLLALRVRRDPESTTRTRRPASPGFQEIFALCRKQLTTHLWCPFAGARRLTCRRARCSPRQL